ncbi:ferrous iron transport protein B [Pontibacter sp. BT310]|uniref:Ferrous iron transport protein B n=1 Tax=Pontibacter populi TaxID=890055 RepID=A0ABS6XGA7_9BACT|nr:MULTISPECIES: ferrous iron transport protein B [Pontibacter]MBJ6120160.1 ferrous iron transport protein B [Pontibacter sp. BT310]MBR0572593.1 ferrous iron transport protein B [Microvirga sp. STS03]MBW3367013.1 ferrous iron transport protein B [Pontibacter populi]
MTVVAQPEIREASQTTPRSEVARVALVGNPNSGKTSLFNQLTGLNQKVGNFPGVTVDKKTGTCQLSANQKVQIIDLPGTYSLYPKSLDERVIIDLLYDSASAHYPDLVVVTADASNLKRNLLLFTQLADLKIPAILALNMVDVAEQEGVKIDIPALHKGLGVPVIPMNARKGIGVAALKILILQHLEPTPVQFYTVPDALKPVTETIKARFGLDSDYLALHYAHQYKSLKFLSAEEAEWIGALLETHEFKSNVAQADETIARYTYINELLLDVVRVERVEKDEKFSNRLDQVLTHKVFGYLIFMAILFLVFQAIFTWASYPMDMIDQGFTSLNGLIQDNFSGPLINLLTEGIIAGLGGVMVFIPQIAILFAFIAVLEETGYMARVTFMMDKIMRKFGLNGKSVVPLISGVACAVPAVMSARTIENWKDRMITIFVTPLMSCSARIPVYTVLIALVVPETYYFGFLNLQGLVLMALYLIGFLAAIFSALLLKVILKARERSYFIMEFPVYKMPRWKNVGLTIVEKVKAFVFEAGKVIVAISIILWVLASYGPGNSFEKAEQQAIVEAKQQNLSDAELRNLISSHQLEASYAGVIGRTMEPAIEPLGYNWKIGIALLTSFAAREVFVGTMSTIYSIGEEENVSTIKNKLLMEKDKDGEPYFNLARSFSLMIFYLFAMQCVSTLAVVRRETKSWTWPLAQLVYMSGLAYVMAFITYQVLS